MAVSLSDLPYDAQSWTTDRWLFHLAEPLNCALGETVLVDGVATTPVTAGALKRWVVGYGNKMIGALRVVGEPCELGDCSALKPADAEAAPSPVQDDADDAGDDAPRFEEQREHDTDMATPRAKKGKRA